MIRVAVQIGTHEAGDFFLDICKKEGFDLIYLIEPLSRHNDVIQKKYKGLSYYLFNVAITPQWGVNETKLYNLNENGGHNSLVKRKSHPIRKSGGEITSIIVPCMTFNFFCETNNLDTIDLLCIDTEGLDDEILMSIDLQRVDIKKIIWENWNHDDDDENGIFRTGTDIKKESHKMLIGTGYRIFEYDHNEFDEFNWCAIKE